jgi:hypothetical protein
VGCELYFDTAGTVCWCGRLAWARQNGCCLIYTSCPTKGNKINLCFTISILFIFYKVVVNLLPNKSSVCILIVFLCFYLCCWWVARLFDFGKVSDFLHKLCERGLYIMCCILIKYGGFFQKIYWDQVWCWRSFCGKLHGRDSCIACCILMKSERFTEKYLGRVLNRGFN